MGKVALKAMKINLLHFLIAPKVYSIYNTIPRILDLCIKY